MSKLQLQAFSMPWKGYTDGNHLYNINTINSVGLSIEKQIKKKVPYGTPLYYYIDIIILNYQSGFVKEKP